MEHSEDGGVVHIVLPNMQPRKGAAPAPVQQPADAPACLGSVGMWALFVVGWVFAPCWWVGTAIGLTTGSDSQCLIRRRRSLSAGQLDAWRACVTMSLLSAAALILVTALWYGRPGPPVDGPYYVTLVGPQDAMPDLTPAKLTAVRTALHSALGLGAAYPASNIAVWLQQATVVPLITRRHLLVPSVTPTQVAVLGYNLALTPELPEPAELSTAMDNATHIQAMADSLAAANFVSSEHLGRLKIGMSSTFKPLEPAALATAVATLAELLHLAPIGVQPPTISCVGAPTALAPHLAEDIASWSCAASGSLDNTTCAGTCTNTSLPNASALCSGTAYSLVQNCTPAEAVWGFEDVAIDDCNGVGTASIANSELRGVKWNRIATVMNTSALSSPSDAYNMCGNRSAPVRATVDGVQSLLIETDEASTNCYTKRRLLLAPACNTGFTAANTSAIQLKSLYATAMVQDGLIISVRASGINVTNETSTPVTFEVYSAEHNFTLTTEGPTFLQLPAEFSPQPPVYLSSISFKGYRTGAPCDAKNATELDDHWGKVLIDVMKHRAEPFPWGWSSLDG